jgi:hypothetical protein
MKKLLRSIIISLLILTGIAEITEASLISYDVFGYIGDPELSNPITIGNIVINDEKSFSPDGSHITYYVDSFNITLGDYNFAGSVGEFHFKYWGEGDYGWAYGIDYTFWLTDDANIDFYSTSEHDPYENWSNFNPDADAFTLPETFGCYVGHYPIPTTLDFGEYFLFTNPTPVPVPEPATLLLFGTGLAGLYGAHRRRKR